MTTPASGEVTELLRAWGDGDQTALDKLAPLVQAELQRLAKHYLRQERRGHTLQTTALINEVYLRLIEWHNVRWQDRAHFFGLSAQLMRRALVDYARRRRYLKRRGCGATVSLDDVAVVSPERSGDLVALDEALARLAAVDPRKSRIVELRFFGGLSVEETAEVLKVSLRTIKREWSLARAWLYNELSSGDLHDRRRPSAPAEGSS